MYAEQESRKVRTAQCRRPSQALASRKSSGEDAHTKPCRLAEPKLCGSMALPCSVPFLPGIEPTREQCCRPADDGELQTCTGRLGGVRNGTEIEKLSLECRDLVFTTSFGPDIRNGHLAGVRTHSRFATHRDMVLARTTKGVRCWLRPGSA